jgi:hypothetical protein
MYNYMYGIEACPLSSRDKQSIEFTITRVFMRMFHTGSATIVADCQRYFNFLSIYHQIAIRTAKFLQCLSASEYCYINYFPPSQQGKCKFCFQFTVQVYKLHVNCEI